MERQNVVIILALSIIAGYCLYLGNSEIAAACVGALSTALTSIVKGAARDTSAIVPADHNGV